MFLKKLYHQWPKMFYVVLLFITAQAFFMYKGVETVPFFLFSMYAVKLPPSNTTYSITVYVNGKKAIADNIISRESETLMGSFDYYMSLKNRHFLATDSATIAKRFKGRLPEKLYNMIYNRLTNNTVNDSLYLNWWGKYLSQVLHKKVDSFALVGSSLLLKPRLRLLKDSIFIVRYAYKH